MPTVPLKADAPVTLSGIRGQPIAVVVQPKTEAPWQVQYAPYGTAVAAVVAASIAALVALRGIRESRKNLSAQLDVQRALAAEQLTAQRELTTRQLDRQQELAMAQLETQRQLAAKTSRASVVSANRQRWIDGLREDLAELISADFVLLENSLTTQGGRISDDAKTNGARVSAAADLRRMLYNRIKLRLNPDKPAHVELLEAMSRFLEQTDIEAHGQALEDLTAKAQTLLRREWLRVKAEASGEDIAIPAAAESQNL